MCVRVGVDFEVAKGKCACGEARLTCACEWMDRSEQEREREGVARIVKASVSEFTECLAEL